MWGRPRRGPGSWAAARRRRERACPMCAWTSTTTRACAPAWSWSRPRATGSAPARRTARSASTDRPPPPGVRRRRPRGRARPGRGPGAGHPGELGGAAAARRRPRRGVRAGALRALAHGTGLRVEWAGLMLRHRPETHVTNDTHVAHTMKCITQGADGPPPIGVIAPVRGRRPDPRRPRGDPGRSAHRPFRAPFVEPGPFRPYRGAVPPTGTAGDPRADSTDRSVT